MVLKSYVIPHLTGNEALQGITYLEVGGIFGLNKNMLSMSSTRAPIVKVRLTVLGLQRRGGRDDVRVSILHATRS